MTARLLFAFLSLVAARSYAAETPGAVVINFEEAEATSSNFRPSMPNKKEVNQLSARCINSDTGQIIPDCNISVMVKAVPHSGGHSHASGTRPSGGVSPASGNSGASGIFAFVYTSPEVSGNIEITITGSKPGLTFRPFDGQFQVAIMGLIPLSAGTDYDLVGQTPTHPVNHYGVSGFHQKLIALAKQYGQAFPGNTLHFNDMSLALGGVFDLQSTWKPPHAEHRIGFSEDLRLVPSSQRAKLELMIRSLGLGINKEEAANHWHIRFDPRGRL